MFYPIYDVGRKSSDLANHLSIMVVPEIAAELQKAANSPAGQVKTEDELHKIYDGCDLTRLSAHVCP